MEYIKIDKNTPVYFQNSLFENLKILLADLELLYPFFTAWLKKVFEEMQTSYTRKIFLCTNTTLFDIVGVAIIKDSPTEKKICTLQVCKAYQRRGIGTVLLDLAIKELNDSAPLITVSGTHMRTFAPFLRKRGFVLCDKVKSLYRKGSYEYFFNKPYKHNVVLLSIQPIFACAIERGEKTIEFRKQPFANNVKRVYVYSTSPVKRIIGYFQIKEIICDTPDNMWSKYHTVGSISRDKFFEYFKGHVRAFGILIQDYVHFKDYKDPKMYDIDFRAPQSFCYIDNVEFLDWLEK